MDKIFRHFISNDNGDDAQKLAYAGWFVDTFPATEFTSDELLYWKFLEYCTRLNVPAKRKYLDIWITSELRKILHKENIKVPGCESIDFNNPQAFENACAITGQVLCDDFAVLELEPCDSCDFSVEVADFMQKRCNERVTQIMSDAYGMISSSDDTTDAASYILDEVQLIQDIYSEDNLEILGTLDVNKSKMVFVSDSGLPAIDNDSKGIYTSQLFDVEAQSGTGKTRFVLGTYIYRAAVLYKKNALFISLEQKRIELEAMLIALHVFNMFNVQLDANMIVTDSVPDEFKTMVEAARIDLFDSGNYGKLELVEDTLYVETFRTKLKNYDRLKGPFDLIAIDYMGLFESKPARGGRRYSEKYEIIADAMKYFKRYLRNNNKAGISISQFNRDGVAAGKGDKEITTDHAEGGLAVFRNTDYNIAISMTDAMRAKQVRRFSQPKVRASRGFPRFLCDTRLGFCYWRQQVSKEV